MATKIPRTIWRWLPLVLVFAAPLVLVAGEWRYAASVAPSGISTIDDHLDRFGSPEFITEVKRHGDVRVYFELSGFPNKEAPRLAFPSAQPAYVYDSSGMLVDWCGDPGDTDDWRRKWRPVSAPSSDVQPILERLRP